MKKCIICGTKMEEGLLFCPHCGARNEDEKTSEESYEELDKFGTNAGKKPVVEYSYKPVQKHSILPVVIYILILVLLFVFVLHVYKRIKAFSAVQEAYVEEIEVSVEG